MAKLLKPRETAEREFNEFGKTDPVLVQTLGKLSEMGARFNTDLANVLATLVYVQKAPGTLREKKEGYETVLQALLDVSANLASHGALLSKVLTFIVAHAEDIYNGYKSSKASTFEKYLYGLTVQSSIKENEND